MVVDPETWITTAEIALVGGLTGCFSQDIYNSGKNWIKARFKDHPIEAQESANRNVNSFFEEVNIRVDALGKLAVHTATNAILQLSPEHLKFLGVLSVIHDLQPASHPDDIDFKDLPQWYSKWLSDELSPMIPIGAMTEYDFMHLVAISCITYIPPQYPITTLETMTFASKIMEEPDEWKLNAILEKKFQSFTGYNVLGSSLLVSNIGQELTKYWKDGLIKRASLTSAGSLIGMYVRDTLLQ